MSENVTNELILEHLKAIRTELVSLRSDVTDIKNDIRNLKVHMAGFMQTEIVQDSVTASLTLRVERIERRLELRD